MQHIFAFVEFYLSPFIIALGMIFLFRGVINYYFIGVNLEEDRKEIGRHSLLWAAVLFAGGLLIFAVAHWLLVFTSEFDDRVDVEVQDEADILKVPNVPGVR